MIEKGKFILSIAKKGLVKIQYAYHFVIQTTVGRKNLDNIKNVSEILRCALDDKKI